MDCSTFKRKHDGFIDDTLSGVEMAAMREHLRQCARCARTDRSVHRALLVARNLPELRVSEGFADRLRARLQGERVGALPGASWSSPLTLRWTAVSAVLVGVLAISGWQVLIRPDERPSRLPAVIATSPPADPFTGDDGASAFVASMSTGIPMWPALMLAEEGPLLFVASELQDNGLDSRER
jgi:hypothetical protein